MNDFTRNLDVCTKEKIFHPRNEKWGLPCINHTWKIFVFDNDSEVGIAVCTTCAKISGGWVTDE